MANPWFRLYSEIIDDENIRLLSFEDRWHYVALLCCKNSGMLDKQNDQTMLMRKLGIKLGLAKAELESALLRLCEAELITLPDCQPCAWEKRQYLPNRGMPESEDASDKRCYVYFIGDQSTNRVKIGFSKNPWSRLSNLQTGSSSKLEILCHLRTSGVSEAEIHRLLSEYSVGGEWFRNEGMVADSITCIRAGRVTDASHLQELLRSRVVTTVAISVAATVAATTDTDTDTDTEADKDIDTYTEVAEQGQQADLLTGKAVSVKKPVKTAPKVPTTAELLADLPDDLATDFIQHRKALKAPITHTAVEGIKREAKKASMTFEQAVTCIIERGWRGFKAEWVTKDQPVSAQSQKDMGSGLPRMQA